MALYDSTTGKVNAFDSFHRHQVIIGNLRIPLFFRFTQNPNRLTFRFEKEYNTTRTIGGYVFESWGRKPVTMQGEVLIKKDNSFSRLIGINDKMTNYDIEDSTYNAELITLMTLFNVDQRKLKSNKTLDSISSFLGVNQGTRTTSTVTGATSAFAKLASNIVKVDPSISALDYTDTYETPEQSAVQYYLNNMTDTVIYYKGCLYTGFFKQMDYVEDGKEPFFNRVKFTFICTGTTFDWLDTMLTQTAKGRTIAALWGAASSALTLGSLLDDLMGNVKSLVGK